jgi:multidrug efflux system outer membrane protein
MVSRIASIFVGLVALLQLPACAWRSDLVEPNMELAASFSETPNGPFTEEAVPDALWQSFGDPTLDTLIERALAANNSIAQAMATLDETRALSKLTLFSWFPTFGVSSDRQRSTQSTVDPFGFPQSGTTERYRAGFDMTWEIDLFGSLRHANRAIRQRLEADTAALAAVRLSIIAEVAQTYFALRGAQHRLEVQQRNRDNLDDSVTILEASVAAGRGTDLDVTRVSALERSVAAQLPQSEADIARAEHRLAVLTAQPAETLQAQLGAPRQLPTMPTMVAVGTPQDWLRRRPDVFAAEHRLAETVSRVGIEASEYYPKLTLIGDFGWTSAAADDLGSDVARRWSLGPFLSWRILDFGRIRQNVIAAEARSQRAYAAFEETLLLAIEEAENGLAGYRAASETAAALAQAVEQSQQSATLARLRYDNGITDYLTVLDAERSALTLEDQYAVALTNRVTALAALYKALGGDFAVAQQ